MTFAWTPYALPFIAAFVLGVGLTLHVAQHRETAVGPAFVVLLSAISAWMGLEAVIVLAADIDSKLVFGRACYPVIMLIAPALVYVAQRCNDPTAALRPWQWILVGSVPAVTLPLLFSDPVPGPFYLEASLDPHAPYARRLLVRGPAFHLIVGHSYALVGWATWLFARRARSTWREHGLDGAMMLAGVFVPWTAVSLHVLGLDPLPHLDAAPFGFAGMALLLYFGFKRTGLLGVVGVGRRRVVDEMRDGVIVTDLRGLVMDANSAALELLDARSSAFVGSSAENAFARHPDLLAAYRAWVNGDEDSMEVDLDVSGEARTFDLDVSDMRGLADRVVCHVLVLRDITDRKRAESALERESEFVQLIQQVAVAANEARTTDGALDASLRIICKTMHWPIGQVCRADRDRPDGLRDTPIRYVDSLRPDSPMLARVDLWTSGGPESIGARALASGKPIVRQLDTGRCSTADQLGLRPGIRAGLAMPVVLGDEVPAVLEFASFEAIDTEEELLGVLAHLGDVLGRVIERKRNEERIRELAYFDGLTGLPNRESFLQCLSLALSQAENDGRLVALLFVDLDGFKRINDTLGHSAGDSLLQQVSVRFASCVRGSDVMYSGRHDAKGDALDSAPLAATPLSRLGGDEFTVLLSRISAPEDAGVVAARLMASLTKPFEVAGTEVFAGASIGVAIFPSDASTAEDLLSNADAAMYAAKERGAGGIEYYSESMNRKNWQRLDIEGALRQALDRDEFRVVYQPLRCARSGRIPAVEALLRWDRPRVGPVSPADFIPVAERSGLIVPIGDWVLETACAQAAEWREDGLEDVRVAINVSGVQMRHGDFADKVAAALEVYDLPPASLEIEITESAVLADDAATHDTLESLKQLGVGLALDDFGTGTSSLTHLRELSIDRVKVDRSFVSDVADNAQDAAITAAIIAMAHGLGLSVVAEGVETEDQARFLTHHSCDELQGFLFARPLPADEVAPLLRRNEKREDPTAD